MSKVPDSAPNQRPRSESFLRLLELEKRFKMQRTRQAQAPTTSSAPSASSSSANANHPPFKTRRLSAHPPLSHQIQIMKAVRRSSALPSLSISIPPSPTEDSDTGTDGPHGKQPLGNDSVKKEHAKTVTFSDPDEEEDLNASDHSSICQSPSWEQYGQRKKKKPKKGGSGEDKRDKDESLLKKKGTRLSKAPPQDAPRVNPLATTDRSRSAPQLESYLKNENENPSTAKPALQDKMTNQQLAEKAPAQELNTKPKGRGFLSNFRLQHGNVAAVQKIIDTSQVNIDDNPSIQGGDPNSINLRKPPSIKSVISTSTRSNSSLEKRPPSSRYFPGSGHGRSQSLLSSTLNKLKGPSYLYYHSTGNGNDSQTKRPSSARGPEPTHEKVLDSSKHQQPEKGKGAPKTATESTQSPSDSALPSKPKQEDNEPGPEIAPRARKSRITAGEPRGVSSDHELPTSTRTKARQVQVESSQTSKRDSVMAMIIAQEKQSRTDRLSQQERPRTEVPSRPEDRTKKARNQNQEVDTHASGYVRPVESVRADPNSMAGKSFYERTDSRSSVTNQVDRLDLKHGDVNQEDDEMSIGTHASTIRPPSRSRERITSEANNRHMTSTAMPKSASIGRAVTTEGAEETVSSRAVESVEDRGRGMHGSKSGKMIPTQYPQQQERSADYFAFISESYAPPSLELRSPSEDRSPSHEITEELQDEEDGDGFFRNYPLKHGTVSPREPTKQAIHAAASYANGIGKAAGELKSKGSPAIFAHYSDSDLPVFERLGISPKAARILAGMETASISTSQSHQMEPSHSTSERSSSSTYEDAPPSPSSATTPDSSRPQSRKGNIPFSADDSQNTLTRPSMLHEEKVLKKSHRPPPLEPRITRKKRPSSRDSNAQDESWSRTAMPIDIENQSSTSLVASPTSVTFADGLKEERNEAKIPNRKPDKITLPPRAQSAADVHSTTKSLPLRGNHTLFTQNPNNGTTSISLPSSPPEEPIDEVLPRKSALKLPRNQNIDGQDAPSIVSPGAAYLQEARRNAPAPPNPTSRALRPQYTHKNSSGSVQSSGSSDRRAEPLAKMLVECCNCKFFHDMPSRVYECMAKPDSVVEDKLLGVSAAITTMVKCPWCGHGMTTQCCAGYAAVVYLKEKLHGR